MSWLPGGLSLDQAMRFAEGLMRDMGRKVYTDREIMILARELKRHHDAGRMSMYRTIAAKLDMVTKADLKESRN